MLFGRQDRKKIKILDKKVQQWKYTTCGYCSTGCSIEVGLDEGGRAVATRGVATADVNRGKLCIKGIFEHELFEASGRGTTPIMRDKPWDDWQPTSGTAEIVAKTSPGDIRREFISDITFP